MGKLANNFFREKKISISQETINLLVEKCKGDRENLKNELLKIEIYSKDKKNISSQEINKLTNLAENYSHSELADFCLSKKNSITHTFKFNATLVYACKWKKTRCIYRYVTDLT